MGTKCGVTPREASRNMLRTTLLLALLALAMAIELKAEHHHEDTDHGDRGAMYRFGVDNFDKNGKGMGKQRNVQVDIRLPIDAVVDEKYYYKEGATDSDEAYQECDQQADGNKHTLIRCEIAQVIEHTTLYVHAHFPKKHFSNAKLAHLEETGATVKGSLSKDDVHINDAHLPLLKHWTARS